MNRKPLALLIFIVLVAGCVKQGGEATGVNLACIQECKKALEDGRDLGNGPCLLNPIPEYKDWVCDVAHDPRQVAIDNLPENQCSTYRDGSANHFVEVTPTCEFIRSG